MAFQHSQNINASGSIFNDVSGNQINVTNQWNSAESSIQTVVAIGAAYYSAERHPAPTCLAGTRTDVLEKINHWARDSGGCRMLFLNGPAGSGKSTIAQTVAEHFADSGILGASFFFARGTMDRNNTTKFFLTIAHQLSTSTRIPDLTHRIREGPHILHANPRFQLKNLIVDPLLETTQDKQFVVVIDSLDECEDEGSVQELISLLTDALRDIRLPLRFLTTSRPEPYIRAMFKEPETYSLSLHEFDAYSDITAFLRYRFNDIYRRRIAVMRGVPKPWPSGHDLQTLARQSSGLFIFASTLLKFVDDRGGIPSEQLKIILDGTPSRVGLSGIDNLYKQILRSALPDPNSKLILGTIMLLFRPLSARKLASLLQLKRVDVWRALRGFHSIISIPDDSGTPIQLFHTSLHDFLTNKSRSGEFFIDTPLQHAEITCLCLATMEKAINYGFFSQSTRSVNVQAMELSYYCRYWASHLSRALPNEQLVDDIRLFVSGFVPRLIESKNHADERMVPLMTDFATTQFEIRVHVMLHDILRKGTKETFGLSSIIPFSRGISGSPHLAIAGNNQQPGLTPGRTVMQTGNARLQQLELQERQISSFLHLRLDQVYKEMLSSASYPLDRQLLLGAFILCRDISIEDLAHLLGCNIPPSVKELSVLRLSSGLHGMFKGHRDSLKDFLTNRHRADEFFVHPPTHHAQITHLCLRTMTAELKIDVDVLALIQSSPTWISFRDSCQHVACSISGQLKYSCLSWVNHLLEASASDELARHLRSFILSLGWQWIETMTILSPWPVTGRATQALKAIVAWLQNLSSQETDLMAKLASLQESASALETALESLPLQREQTERQYHIM